MRTHAALLAAGLTLAVLAACKRPEPARPVPPASATPAAAPAAPATPATGGFSHDAAFDGFGYYMPTGDEAVGSLKLDHIHIGPEEDLKKWEAGERMTTYAPVMIAFDDTSSAKVADETGGESYGVQIRVFPTHYELNRDGVNFTGRDARLGEVSFEGRFDKEALASAKAFEPDSDGVVLSGRLRVGARTWEKASFTWSGGD